MPGYPGKLPPGLKVLSAAREWSCYCFCVVRRQFFMVRRHIRMESEMAAGGVTLSASNEMLALLGSQDWEPMLKELLCYAMTRIKDREWLSVWGGQPPGAKEAHDVVMDSVIDV